eukprot:1156360-Pelagomonas_calceolata.AAC.2
MTDVNWQLRKVRHVGSKEPLVPSTSEQEKEGLVGIWRVARSTRFENLAVRINLVFNSARRGYKFVTYKYT